MTERFGQPQARDLSWLASEWPSLALAMEMEAAREARVPADVQELIVKMAQENPT